MKKKVRVHDGIVGSLILGSLILAEVSHPHWSRLAMLISILMIISFFTGFCPVYFILDKVMKKDDKCC